MRIAIKMAEESCPRVLESKRLFVGGLNHGVSQKELRMKFEPFGNVKDLEVITRKDDSGEPLKTFAYINIDVSEKDFKKCLTIYNNCTWKGNVLKIQIAKEDYLSRLQREKILKTEPRKSVGNVSDCVVSDMKSAVPGTPVPEKRNWVVGKFGRVLPIVFLRRKDGRKVAKFDPSKTVHCLKKIRVDETQPQSVNNLTWNIESSCANVCEISKKHDPKKRVADDVQGKDESKIPKKARRKSKDFEIETEIVRPLDVSRCGFEDKSISFFQHGEMSRSDESNDENPSDSEINSLENDDGSTDGDKDELVAHKIDVDVCPLNCRNDAYVSDDSERDLSNDSNVSTDDDNFSKIGSNLHEEKQNKSKETKESAESDAPSIIAGDTSPNISVNGCGRNTNEVISRNHQSNSLNNDDVCSKDSLSDSSSEDDSSVLNNNNLSNKIYQTPGSKASMSKIDITSSKSNHSLSNTDVTSTRKNSLNPENEGGTRPTVNSSLLLRKSDSKKREVSNSLRLESLKERTQVIQKQKDIVKNALQKVDSEHFKGSNHLILDGNGEGLNIPAEGKKITGAKALSWLGMDSSDENDTNQDSEIIGWKEHFDGKSGEKLMKLQQTFGHDIRFKMDERFLESDEELDFVPKNDLNEQTKKRPFSEVGDGDEIDRQLHEEKQLSFKILQEVLGRNSVFVEETDDYRNHYRDSLTTHYDPSREDHADFEENVVKPISPEAKEIDIPKKASETELPEVAKSKFYSVSDSLKNLFESKNQESNTFSFFTDLNENEKCTENIVIEKSEEITKWKAPLEISQNLPYDSSASEDELEEEELRNLAGATKVDSSKKKDYQRHLFYHLENKTMMNTLEEESSSFMRKGSIESLKKYWLEVRQNLTQDYKKKRKDALRRQKKMSHKQN